MEITPRLRLDAIWADPIAIRGRIAIKAWALAQREIDTAQAGLNRDQKLLDSAQQLVDQAQKVVDRDQRELDKIQREVDQARAAKIPQPPEPLELKKRNQPKPTHASLSWTACHDDACLTHLSEKRDSGWFPQSPRPRSHNSEVWTDEEDWQDISMMDAPGNPKEEANNE